MTCSAEAARNPRQLHTGNDQTAKLAEYLAKKAAGKSPKKPKVRLPRFLTFIRQPLCDSFRVPGRRGYEPYEFLTVNAHLLYGEKSQKREREMEFDTLMEWENERFDRKEPRD